VAELLHQARDRISNNVRVLLIIACARLSNIGNDPGDLLCFLRVTRFEVHRRCQTQTARDAVRDAIGSSYCMTDAVTQTNTTGVKEGEERRVTGEEESGAHFSVLWVRFGLWEVCEEIFDGLETHALCRNFGGERVVHQLDCVVKRPYLVVVSASPRKARMSYQDLHLCWSKGSKAYTRLCRRRRQQLRNVSYRTFNSGKNLPFGTSSGSLTAILAFSSVVKPAFCVVSATLKVVGTAMLGIHFPVS
jgi:hypothetical protein